MPDYLLYFEKIPCYERATTLVSLCGINNSVGCCCRFRVGRYPLPLLSIPETVFIMGLLPLELYCQGLHRLFGLDRKLPFLPLMLTSVYCAVGVSYVWLKAHYLMWTS